MSLLPGLPFSSQAAPKKRSLLLLFGYGRKGCGDVNEEVEGLTSEAFTIERGPAGTSSDAIAMINTTELILINVVHKRVGHPSKSAT
jgi:hypothetical protein